MVSAAAEQIRFICAVEIVLQFLETLAFLGSVSIFAFGMSYLKYIKYGSLSLFMPSPIFGIAGAIQGLMMGMITFWVASLCFNAWMVYLVYTGGYYNKIHRLRLWLDIKIVFLVLGVLGILVLLSVSSCFMVASYFIWIVYRTYSIIAADAYITELEILQAR